MPVLHLDGFEGPMDLLLDLAERQRIDLGRISVTALVEQFVAESARVAPTSPSSAAPNGWCWRHVSCGMAFRPLWQVGAAKNIQRLRQSIPDSTSGRRLVCAKAPLRSLLLLVRCRDQAA
jgi:hypothetical protein